MSINYLANSAAPVLSATLLMNPPAAQYRPTRRPQSPPRVPAKRPGRRWRSLLKSIARPLVPVRYRSRVRLVLVASNALPKPAAERTSASRDSQKAA
jgi:hypothetical protein